MKAIITVVAALALSTVGISAEEIKVYPKGVTEKQIKKHGRARTKARIHQITRSGIFSGLTEEEKDKIRKEAMQMEKHNWSTSEKEKSHKRRKSVKVNQENMGSIQKLEKR